MTPPVPGWEEWVQQVTPYVAEAAFFSGIGFIVAYTFLARWWRSSIGITIVLLDLMIALVLLPDILLYLFRVSVAGSEFWTFLVLGAFAAVPLIILWRFCILLRAQLHGRDREDADA